MKAILLALAAGLCWGVGELCTKSVLNGQRIGPITAIAVRSTVALPVLWFAWYLAARALAPRVQCEPTLELLDNRSEDSRVLLLRVRVVGATSREP